MNKSTFLQLLYKCEKHCKFSGFLLKFPKHAFLPIIIICTYYSKHLNSMENQVYQFT